MDNYGHIFIYVHKFGPGGCLLKDNGICRSQVKKANCTMSYNVIPIWGMLGVDTSTTGQIPK